MLEGAYFHSSDIEGHVKHHETNVVERCEALFNNLL
jgi:hypothetical protein